tara:strand:- start:1349 stop:1486 length:138 start_codon:yes stop_codon:yes gene_type:complete
MITNSFLFGQSIDTIKELTMFILGVILMVVWLEIKGLHDEEEEDE